MKFLAMVRRLPQPMRTLYFLVLAVFVVGLISSLLGAPPVWAPIFAILALLLGASLLSNFRGSSTAFAQAAAGYKPRGVDFSQSIMATTRYARFFGGCISLVGIMVLALFI